MSSGYYEFLPWQELHLAHFWEWAETPQSQEAPDSALYQSWDAHEPGNLCSVTLKLSINKYSENKLQFLKDNHIRRTFILRPEFFEKYCSVGYEKSNSGRWSKVQGNV